MPACGFSVKLDYLLDVVQADHPKKIQVAYPQEKELEAFKIARQLRETENVVLVKDNEKKEIEVIR